MRILSRREGEESGVSAMWDNQGRKINSSGWRSIFGEAELVLFSFYLLRIGSRILERLRLPACASGWLGRRVSLVLGL